MFEVREVNTVDATGRWFAAGLLSAGSVIGSAWLVASLPAILAC